VGESFGKSGALQGGEGGGHRHAATVAALEDSLPSASPEILAYRSGIANRENPIRVIMTMTIQTADVGALISERTSALDLADLRARYFHQGEFLHVEEFLPPELLERWLDQLEQLKPHIHRNFVPRHKKGGSVSFSRVQQSASDIAGVYYSPELVQFLQQVADAPMKLCPDSDPHRCALYAYTEEGDHIGFHYDTSYYKDRRWTLLVGLKDESSSRLLCHLHTKTPGRAVEKLEVQIKPGAVVLFNGDTVYHAVSPTKRGEERYIISMQFVTTGEMNPFLRLFSNLKDAFAYFGLKEVFFGSKRPGTSGH
jgi:hypothetical protein